MRQALASIFQLIIFACAVGLLLYTFNRGLTYHDEGYILQAGERVLEGQIPYRDFHYIYTPLTIYLTAFAFKLFGVSIFAERLLLLFFSFFTLYVVYHLLLRITHQSQLAFLGIISFVAWGPTHINFIWPIIIALNFSLFSIYLIFIDQPFMAGIVAGLVGLAKQNLGLATIASFLVWFIWQKKKVKINGGKFILGVTLPILFCLWYLFQTQALTPFLDQFYQYTIHGKLLDRSLRFVFLEYRPWYSIVGKTLLYTLPLTSALAVIFLSWKQKKNTFNLISLFTIFFYSANSWPDADYTHIAPTLGLAGINLLLLYKLVGSTVKKRFLLGATFTLAGVGIWSALFLGYYRWETPLFKNTYFLKGERERIYVDDKYRTIAPAVTTYVQKSTRPNDPVFVYYNAPMFNFLANRANPSRGLDLSPGVFPNVYLPKIVQDLNAKPPKLVITHWDKKDWQNTLIGQFIVNNYILDYQTREIGIWKK